MKMVMVGVAVFREVPGHIKLNVRKPLVDDGAALFSRCLAVISGAQDNLEHRVLAVTVLHHVLHNFVAAYFL